MNEILIRLFDHERLSRTEAAEVLTSMSQGMYNSAQLSSFLTVYMMRPISLEELQGFRDALLNLCVTFDVGQQQTIDVCGTGGDGKNTFNISTLSALVVAASGYKVTKHGNYGVSSGCGSSNVLEAAGVKFTNDSAILNRQLDEANICFLHAPLFHPALKGIGPIRRELGLKTFFNMLGPMVNPAQPSHQMVGVFNLQLMRLYQYFFENTDSQYAIVYGLDGFDEISLTDDTKLITASQGEEIINAASFNLENVRLDDIGGGSTIEEAKNIFLNVLRNECTDAQKNVVLANSAAAIRCMSPHQSLTDCFAIAQEGLESGQAFNTLQKLLMLQ